jgi:uncharacterized protein
VNSKLPSREQANLLLRKYKCPPKVIRHCEAVAQLATETAHQLQKRGVKINVELVEAGALLHDLGRSKTHTVDHAIEGAKIAEAEGLPKDLVDVIKRHLGGGITAQEAAAFGWPKDSYAPVTLEDKVVSYADKLIDKAKRVPIEVEIKRLKLEGKAEAAERVRRLYEEITTLLGTQK